MKKALRKAARIAALAAGSLALLLVGAGLFLYLDKPLVRGIARSEIARRTGMAVRIGKLDYRFFPFRVSIEGLRLERETPLLRTAVSVGRLSTAGDLRKALRGERPAFGAVDAEDVALVVELKAPDASPVDVGALSRQAADALTWAGRVLVTKSRASVSMGPRRIALEGLSLSLAPGDDGSIAFALGPCVLEAEDAARGIGGGGDLTLSGAFRTSDPISFRGKLGLRSARVRRAGAAGPFDGASLDLEGGFDLRSERFEVSLLEVSVPGLFGLSATGRGAFKDGISLDSELRADVVSLGALVARSGSRLPGRLRDARLDGRAVLAGALHWERAPGGDGGRFSGGLKLEGLEAGSGDVLIRGTAALSGRCDVSLPSDGAEDRVDIDAALERADLEGAAGGSPFRLGLTGRARLKGDPRDPRWTADIRATAGRLAVRKMTVGSSSAHIVAHATRSSADVSLIQAALEGLEIAAATGKTLSFEKLRLAGKARVERGGGVRVDAELSGLPDLPPLVATGRFGMGPSAPTSARLESKKIGLAALRALVGPLLPAGLAGWDLDGSADVSLEATGPGRTGGTWRLSGSGTGSDIRLNDPAFAIAAEGLAPALAFEGAWAPSRGASLSGTLELKRGESLWKTVYVPWADHPLKASFAGRYDLAGDLVDDISVRVRVPTIGSIDVFGSVRLRPSPELALEAGALLHLGPLRALVVPEGTASSERIKLDGTLGASLRARQAGDALSVEGRLSLAGADVELIPSGTRLSGVSADIPVRYDSAAAVKDAEPAEPGSLSVAEIEHPLLTLRDLAIALRSGTNAVAAEPFGADIFGGRLELGRTTFRFDPATGALGGTGSLALRGIDISRIPIASSQFRLTGRAGADFPIVKLTPDLISLSGRGEAELFGGKVVVRDLSVSEPFSPGRAIALNVDIVDIDLKKLTDAVPFGEVTGIVRGEILGLVLSYGQPSRFDLRLESVPRKGVPRTFSLKAVDNLTVLSSGQAASAGTGPFWMRFIRGFRYEKLGIVSTLRNDTFTLNGTIREGGVEYLVKKPPLFGINVVNRMPDKKISFKEMSGRLKRVGQSETRPGNAGRRVP